MISMVLLLTAPSVTNPIGIPFSRYLSIGAIVPHASDTFSAPERSLFRPLPGDQNPFLAVLGSGQIWLEHPSRRYLCIPERESFRILSNSGQPAPAFQKHEYEFQHYSSQLSRLLISGILDCRYRVSVVPATL